MQDNNQNIKDIINNQLTEQLNLRVGSQSDTDVSTVMSSVLLGIVGNLISRFEEADTVARETASIVIQEFLASPELEQRINDIVDKKIAIMSNTFPSFQAKTAFEAPKSTPETSVLSQPQVVQQQPQNDQALLMDILNSGKQ